MHEILSEKGEPIGAYRDFQSIVRKWQSSGLLKENAVNDIRLQLDGTPMRTDMAEGPNNLFVALAHQKFNIGRSEEYHLATYFGQENAANFRSYLNAPIQQVVKMTREGINFGNVYYHFRLLVCCDYVALAKLMGCGYHSGNFRCALCYYDVRNPGNFFKLNYFRPGRPLCCATITSASKKAVEWCITRPGAHFVAQR